jgi:hypothetical protein
MSFVTNQGLFRVNQQLLTLLATNPSVHANVDCFNVTRRPGRGQVADRTESAPVLQWLTASDPKKSMPCIPAAHFRALLSAMSSAFPDFDFCDVCPWNFKRILAPEKAQADINWAFQTQIDDCESLLTLMWLTLEKEISPAACSIYAYETDRPDAFSESGAAFNLCYFFLNEKSGKVVLVHLREGADVFDSDDDDEFVDDTEERLGYAVF